MKFNFSGKENEFNKNNICVLSYWHFARIFLIWFVVLLYNFKFGISTFQKSTIELKGKLINWIIFHLAWLNRQRFAKVCCFFATEDGHCFVIQAGKMCFSEQWRAPENVSCAARSIKIALSVVGSVDRA